MKKRNKVILVEDNFGEAQLTRIAFEAQQIPSEIIHCEDGEKFLALLSRPDAPHNEINYILLDLNMPRIGGIEVLKKVGRHHYWCHLPIIVFTSSCHESDVLKCYELGAKAYVLKPIDFEQFQASVQAIDNLWGHWNTFPQLPAA
ncbi:MAG: response regulator [Saprospiraceae bacterium]